MKELTGVCKKCVFGCNRLEDKNFTGVEKCQYCTLKQISIEQMKMEGLDDIPTRNKRESNR